MSFFSNETKPKWIQNGPKKIEMKRLSYFKVDLLAMKTWTIEN